MSEKRLSWEEYCADVLQWQNDELDLNDRIINAGLGIADEAGEVAGAVKKRFFYKVPPYRSEFDFREKLVDEMGDTLWYFALMCECIGSNLEEVMRYNMEKLRRRHSGGT